ncbi:hypothetical protein DBV05_g11937 [Lasiodiplodia theobromae]|uniref:Uncharacterized protein n=1 Tax=Lasiodiplodia theobromae TaxID=45133 RepID=A0A5N5CVK4_9PEZI|nr:hypothetical protein DBV05_g11937 [Lasiodiplodia theobromae]
MATAKKRKLDSISDGPAPSEPEAKRHHTTNRCRLTELPDELLILIAEHLAGFDDPITYVHQMDGKLIIEHPKAYHDVSLAGLRDLSDTLSIEFEKALHKNGIITFEDQYACAEYFDPDTLNSHPNLMNIRLATQRMRFNIWKLGHAEKIIPAMSQLANLKRVHLGGAWRDKDGPLRFTATPSNVSFFRPQVCLLSMILVSSALRPPKFKKSLITFGPGHFGRNTIYSESDEESDDESDDESDKGWHAGNSIEVNYAALDELIAIWKQDQGTLACTSSIVSMDGETVSSIWKFLVAALRKEDPFDT